MDVLGFGIQGKNHQLLVWNLLSKKQSSQTAGLLLLVMRIMQKRDALQQAMIMVM